MPIEKRREGLATDGLAVEPGQRVVTFSQIVFQKDGWSSPVSDGACQVYTSIAKAAGDGRASLEVSVALGSAPERYTYITDGTKVRVCGTVVHLPRPDIAPDSDAREGKRL